jgi:LmbE family N-acetylglucosaminyl deacetylase
MSHPYTAFVDTITKALQEGKRLPCGGFEPVAVKPAPGSPRVLVFAPHPDDECLVGALPLRLLRELNYSVGVVAVTQGSNLARQQPRLEELRGAVGFLGWDLITTQEGGLMKVTPKGRESDPELWAKSVAIVAEILRRERPKVVFFPHDKDWNQSHIGTHLLVVDAMRTLGSDFKCTVVETEFWAANTAPNLMVEATPEILADLVAATSFHAGEVSRNPYHTTLPAWMADNLRRGGEVVGGQGGDVPDFCFATLYRLRAWNGFDLVECLEGGRMLSANANLADLF